MDSAAEKVTTARNNLWMKIITRLQALAAFRWFTRFPLVAKNKQENLLNENDPRDGSSINSSPVAMRRYEQHSLQMQLPRDKFDFCQPIYLFANSFVARWRNAAHSIFRPIG